ncbi:hypothetical protein OsJ_22100 [Oryza sativa Japonica Group]|uniref:Uncharacterized protein n=1 Tax=Oryza sativa subsp. japonica TaxID=39947 RepID=A3BDX3_ORYSJ|nr:hypothetical protein OsJ_22100 [Oryza sativa Japonica Group]
MSIQGQILEVRVTGCRKLRDTEFFTRQDPYVCIEYATNKFRTRTCTGKCFASFNNRKIKKNNKDKGVHHSLPSFLVDNSRITKVPLLVEFRSGFLGYYDD